MDRRSFVSSACALALSAGAWPARAAGAHVVGLLWVSSPSSERHVAALREGLKRAGYSDPEGVRFDESSLVDAYEKIEAGARRLVERRVEVIVSYGGTAANALKNATRSVPVVMLIGADPVKQGYAKSFSRPGGNMTGVYLLSSETSGKRLELLKRLRPQAKRAALLYNESSPSEVSYVELMQASGRSVGLQLEPAPVRLSKDIAPAIAAAARSGIDGFVVVSSTMLVANAQRVVEAVAKTRLPAIYPNDDFVEAGGILSYGPNLFEAFRMSSGFVARVLGGAKPAEMPIEQYSKLELVVNPRSARAQGFDIPQSVLGLADRVIGA
jgi:putative ABC transport system substrate-binding protein